VTYIYIMMIVIAVQQALDVWTTKTALATGRAREANGPLRELMDHVGVMPALLCTKVLFGATIAFTAQATLVWYIVLSALIALYTWVLFNNFRVLKKIGAL
jgi:hypothetical protein